MDPWNVACNAFHQTLSLSIFEEVVCIRKLKLGNEKDYLFVYPIFFCSLLFTKRRIKIQNLPLFHRVIFPNDFQIFPKSILLRVTSTENIIYSTRNSGSGRVIWINFQLFGIIGIQNINDYGMKLIRDAYLAKIQIIIISILRRVVRSRVTKRIERAQIKRHYVVNCNLC